MWLLKYGFYMRLLGCVDFLPDHTNLFYFLTLIAHKIKSKKG